MSDTQPADSQRDAAAVPYGDCPKCHASIPVESADCVKCGAIFGAGASWKVFSNDKSGPSYSDLKRAATKTSTKSAPIVAVEPPEATPGLDSSLGVLGNLHQGNYGLAKTYWGFGLLGGILVSVAYLGLVFATKSRPVAILGLFALWIWIIFICISIWRAANKYRGSAVWSVLARISVVLGILQNVVATAQLLSS